MLALSRTSAAGDDRQATRGALIQIKSSWSTDIYRRTFLLFPYYAR
ncbi:hypothetical protein [Levilactobacillus senmaizukei]|nr:hypothetical protein [Levilactobacillus senmaizukei]